MDGSFFGFQVAVRAPAEAWRSKLISIVKEGLEADNVAKKAFFYGRLARHLEAAGPSLVLGYWDYLTGEPARDEYHTWVRELEARSGETMPRHGGDHVLVTCAFLLKRHGGADAFVGALCDFPEETWFDRATIVRLIAGLENLPFSSVASDAVYIVPRDRDHDLTTEELREDFDYLKELLPRSPIRHGTVKVAHARCAFCHDTVDFTVESGLVECDQCRTVLHESCWVELGHCPVLGCRGRSSVATRVRDS